MDSAENNDSKGILGIDAGGTFTDLAFIAGADSKVLASTKTPTNHSDLVITNKKGLDQILEQIDAEQIKAINLATTLATNAIVENKIRSCGLIVIGYDTDSVERWKSENKFGTPLVYQVSGGHDPKGNEIAPFDEENFKKICDTILPQIESIAVSSYFSVRNPEHEIRAKEIIRRKDPRVFISCGHELAFDLDALKRATTAALNAGLIPIIIELLESVEKVCLKRGLNVPITIVRGDGSLVSSEWARNHPIETILSGPASSAIGACFLGGAREFGRQSCVVDIGGTTTDIIYLKEDGTPTLSEDGTTVGRHKTLVKSIDIHTFGLGGDSRIRIDSEHNITIGPRRVKSLCSASSESAKFKECLRELASTGATEEPLVVYAGNKGNPSSRFEENMLNMLEDGPLYASRMLTKVHLTHRGMLQLEEMEQKGLINFAGFTPTDALNVTGKLNKWDKEASEIAAGILLYDKNMPVRSFCEKICRKVSVLASHKIFRKKLSKEMDLAVEGEIDRLILHSLSREHPGDQLVKLNIGATPIGVGAPTWAFIEDIGTMLSEKAVLPENAGVAGAVGAAVGSFSLRYLVLVTPLKNGQFRVHMPIGIKDFEMLDEAVNETQALMRPWITERAKKAGALNPLINCTREDEEAWIAGGIRKMHLRTNIYFEVQDAS